MVELMADCDIDFLQSSKCYTRCISRRPIATLLTQQKELVENMMSLDLKVIMPRTWKLFIMVIHI